jgi:hypothetical protein
MKLKFANNYNLFVIYLILNFCGYNDENRKKGMHPVRKMVRSEFQEYNRKNKKFLLEMKGLMKRVYYSRLTQVFVLVREKYKKNKKDMYRGFLEDVKEVKKMMPLIEKFEKEYKLREFFKEKYLPLVSNIINNQISIKLLSKHKKNMAKFLKPRGCEILIIPNLLEAYWRGHSYFVNKNRAILNIGPDDKNNGINWHCVVHESLHFLLRRDFIKAAKNFSPRLKRIIGEKTIDIDYKNNHLMYQIEETIVKAFTPLIMGEKLWDYTIKKFPLTELIYNELKQRLVKGKVKFNQKILNQILRKIEEQYAK